MKKLRGIFLIILFSISLLFSTAGVFAQENSIDVGTAAKIEEFDQLLINLNARSQTFSSDMERRIGTDEVVDQLNIIKDIANTPIPNIPNAEAIRQLEATKKQNIKDAIETYNTIVAGIDRKSLGDWALTRIARMGDLESTGTDMLGDLNTTGFSNEGYSNLVSYIDNRMPKIANINSIALEVARNNYTKLTESMVDLNGDNVTLTNMVDEITANINENLLNEIDDLARTIGLEREDNPLTGLDPEELTDILNSPTERDRLENAERYINTGDAFTKLISRLKELFYATRNLVYVASSFAMLVFAVGWINSGSIDWKQLFWFIIALSILALASDFIEYAVNENGEVYNNEDPRRILKNTLVL